MAKRNSHTYGYPVTPSVPEGQRVTGWRVTQDGVEKFSGSNDDCFSWVLRHQGNSVSYALRYGGYKIEQILEPI